MILGSCIKELLSYYPAYHLWLPTFHFWSLQFRGSDFEGCGEHLVDTSCSSLNPGVNGKQGIGEHVYKH